MRISHRSLVVALGAAALASTACKGRETVRIDANDATFAKRDAWRTLGPGDLRIATTDSALELALVGDSLVAGFGSATRAKIARATDTTRVEGSGIGANIAKIVKANVASALDREVHMPLLEFPTSATRTGCSSSTTATASART